MTDSVLSTSKSATKAIYHVIRCISYIPGYKLNTGKIKQKKLMHSRSEALGPGTFETGVFLQVELSPTPSASSSSLIFISGSSLNRKYKYTSTKL